MTAQGLRRGAVAILVLVLLVALLSLARRAALGAAGRRSVDRATLVAATVGRELRGLEGALVALAADREVFDGLVSRTLEPVRRAVETAVSATVALDGVLVTDERARQRLAFPPAPMARGRDHSFATWYRAAARGAGGPLLDVGPASARAVLAVPVESEEGGTVGFVVGHRHLDLLLHDQRQMVAGDGWWLLIADDGTAAALFESGARGGVRGLEGGAALAWGADTVRLRTAHPENGRPAVTASAPVAGTGWRVVVATPHAVALAGWWRGLAGGTVLVILAGTAFVAWGRRRMLALRSSQEVRRALEAELVRTRDALDQRVRERTAELAALNRRLSDELLRRERIEEALQDNEERYRVVAETAADGVLTCDESGQIVFVNRGAERIFGRSRYDLVGEPMSRIFPDHDVAGLAATGEGAVAELVGRHRDGSAIHTEVSVARYTLGREPLVTAIVRDVTERKGLERRLRESEERYALAAHGANDGLWDWDLQTQTVYFSPRWKAILGYRESEIGGTPEEWLARIDSLDRPEVEAQLTAHLRGELPHFQSQHRMQRKDGSILWVLVRGLAVRDAGGRPTRVAGSLTDVTERKLAEDRLAREALHDSLTGLPNRTLFMHRVEQVLARADGRGELAVLFLDLDGFKLINDSLGHAAGDRLLTGVARRLEGCVRPGDTLARLGGDEFVVLVDRAGPETAHRVADRILEQLARPIELEGREVVTSASIGIASGAQGYERAEDLLRDADTAMYRAKQSGKAQHRIFETSMREEAMSRLEQESELRQALEKGQLLLHYQPIVRLADRRLIGFEALVRWLHPTRGLLPASEFVPLAEGCGLILPLGSWVVEQAVTGLAGWRRALPAAERLVVSVNLSGRHFALPALVEGVADLLAQAGLPAKRLVIEITEGVLLGRDEHTSAALAGLRELGVGLSLDDFGTGYSSLSYLHEVPISALKIDRSFIRNLEAHGSGREIARAVVALGAALDLAVVAEGIETEAQLGALRELGCSLGQGYLLGRPMAPEAAKELIREAAPAPAAG